MTIEERKADLVHAAARRFLKHQIDHHVWFSEARGPKSVLFIEYGYRSPSGVWEREPMEIRLGNWRERRSLVPLLKKIDAATRSLHWRKLKEETALAKENKVRSIGSKFKSRELTDEAKRIAAMDNE